MTRRGIPQIGPISCTAWSGRSRIQQTLITNRLRHLHRSHLLLRLRNLLGVHGARGKDLSLNALGSKVVSIRRCSPGVVPKFSFPLLHELGRAVKGRTEMTEQSKGAEQSSQMEHGKNGQRRTKNRIPRIICDANVCGRDAVRDCRSVPAATWPGSCLVVASSLSNICET